jgi:pyrimidine-nucleoside phosphorylase
MDFKPILSAKRDGKPLDELTIQSMVRAYVDGQIPDYQMSAWLMAVFFRGLDPTERIALTSAMWKSGVSLPRVRPEAFRIDKHSTGGVGDKTSLILVPLVIATANRVLGPGSVEIPMISGRTLGHTGGTLDKLESVPGFSPQIDLARAHALMVENGFFMMGQTADLVPADRLLYSLRDATCTVESIGLMVSSILSKKLAETLDGIIFDVKFGGGAFLPEIEQARNVGRALLDTARALGVSAKVVITSMDAPLGVAIGNRLEVEECHNFLMGNAAIDEGLALVTLTLAAEMLAMASRGKLTVTEALMECRRELETPAPGQWFVRMFEAQGGDWERFQKESWSRSTDRFKLNANTNGYVKRIDARRLGQIVQNMGGGRKTKEDTVDLDVGVVLRKKVGDQVRKGDTLLIAHHRPGRRGSFREEAANLTEAIEVVPEPTTPIDWVKEVMV